MVRRSGGCACGQLRYEADGEALLVHCCHCRWCQRETGSAFATNYLIEADRVDVRGTVETVLTPSNSGRGQKVLRCPSCKVAISSHYSGSGDAFQFLRVGTMDERADVAPDVHIYTSTKQPWVIIPDGVPAFEEFYDPATFWSSETMARWQAGKSA